MVTCLKSQTKAIRTLMFALAGLSLGLVEFSGREMLKDAGLQDGEMAC